MRTLNFMMGFAVVAAGCYQISNVPNPKPCPPGTASRFDGSAWQCETVPPQQIPGATCPAGQVVSWTSNSTWGCQSLPDSAPLPDAACPVGTASQWNGVTWQCATIPQQILPTCNATQVVTWNNGAWGCTTLPSPFPVPPANCTAGVTWNTASQTWSCTASTAIVPAGTVIAYAGNIINPPPSGWLWCNGDSYPVAQPYTTLFNVIGTTYGSASGSPPGFKVPDYRGLFLRGFDPSGNIDPGPRTPLIAGGTPGAGSVEVDDLKTHTHAFAANLFGGTATGLTDTGLVMGAGSGQVFAQTGTSATGGSETRPKNMAVNYLIKY